MEYYVKFINYTAEIVTRREAIHTLIDFAARQTTIFVTGGRVVARGYRELATTFESLPAVREEIRQAVHETHEANKPLELSFGEAQLVLYPRAQADQVIQRLLNRFRRIGTVIKEAETMGLAVERQPYTEYLREIETTGFKRVTLYSVARFSSGKLADVHPLRISGQFSPSEKVDVKVPAIARYVSGGATSRSRMRGDE